MVTIPQNTDTNKYFWYPIMISDELENKEQVSFTEYPSYTSDTVSLVSNNSLRYEKFSPPDSTEEFTYLCFNDDVGFADGIIEPVILSSDGQQRLLFFQKCSRKNKYWKLSISGNRKSIRTQIILSSFLILTFLDLINCSIMFISIKKMGLTLIYL